MSKFPAPELNEEQIEHVVRFFVARLRDQARGKKAHAFDIVLGMLPTPEVLTAPIVDLPRPKKVDLAVDALHMLLIQTRDADKQAAIQSVLEILETRVDVVIDADRVARGLDEW